MIPLAFALSLSSAYACEGPTHQTDCHLEHDDDAHAPRGRDKALTFRLGLEGTGLPGAPTTGGYLDLTGRNDAFLRVEGRATTDERVMGRLSTGLDLLGDKPFDLRVGLFLGQVGHWTSPTDQHLAIGTDITVGAELGRVSGAARWVGGKRAGDRGLWHETDLSLAYRLLGPFRLHGHWLRMTGDGERMAGVGLGGSVTF